MLSPRELHLHWPVFDHRCGVLPHLAVDALTVYRAKGEVAPTGGLVVGSSLPDTHQMKLTQKASNTMQDDIVMAQQDTIHKYAALCINDLELKQDQASHYVTWSWPAAS